MYLIIYSADNLYFPVLNDPDFCLFNIDSVLQIKENEDYLFRTNREEFYLDRITKTLDEKNLANIQYIIIDKNIGGIGWERAANLAGHMVCSVFSSSDLEKKPIILADWKTLLIEDNSLKGIEIMSLFQTSGFYFRTYDELFSPHFDRVTGETNRAVKKANQKLDYPRIEDIKIIRSSDSNHQSTNEWGAIRLASSFGIDPKTLAFKWPQHLYFKYLIKLNDIQLKTVSLNEELKGLFHKILLIDDNAKNGWQEVISKIFDCTVDVIESSADISKYTTPGSCDSYDLILLDLYLENGSKDISKSVEFLKLVKKHNPEIPVVIFTASNKAWNLRMIQNLGADGMYTKESPQFINDLSYLNENKNNFIELIKHIHQKYKILSPYWRQIKNIKLNAHFTSIENTSQKMLRSRIEERLLMFFGLLKKGFEQTEYDSQTFYYSDYELAFMSLWSVLNEIQEAYYVKSQPNVTVNHGGQSYTFHPNNTDRITYLNEQYTKHFKWQIDNYVFCEYEYRIKLNNNGAPKIDSTNKFELKATAKSQIEQVYQPVKGYQLHLTPQENYRKPNYEKLLVMQIAFILINKMGTGLDENDPYIKSLHDLNDIRNHLYLTHGDLSTTNYYSKEERTKRTDSTYTISPTNDIKKLFELVGFMLTRTNTYVNI